ncbi:MAG: sodium:glutamate symporter [Spirochaetales bacterium]|nr:sodium:glutamate symporter [Spirochaetales bacterium]
MGMSWKIVIDAGAISVALLLATFLRAKWRFLQRFMVPNALTAGFILLGFYNWDWAMKAIGYGPHRLGELVYHLLNVSFIAMTLRAPHPKSKDEKGGPFLISVAILWQYAIQALAGLLLTFALIRLVWPELSPAFGLFLPLGFALGPGQAFAIGQGWEGMGFSGAATVGLAFAAIGYLWSSFVGVPLITWGIKRGRVSKLALEAFKDRTLMSGIVAKDREPAPGGRLSTDSEAIDSFSFHAALVVFTYLLSYLLLTGLTRLLALAGPTGVELGANLWGINFIFSSVTAMLVRVCMKGLGIQRLADDGTLTRLSGFAVDFMVAGAIAAISLEFVARYWGPLLVVTMVGGLVVTLSAIWMSSRLFRDHPYERMLMVYGCSTGTLSTGLALLRVLDPEFRTPVASDYMKSAGLSFLGAIPFILSINLPAKTGQTGDWSYFWTMIGVSAAYLVVTSVAFLILARGRGLKKPGRLWLDDPEI